jgi:hypothetical protein
MKTFEQARFSGYSIWLDFMIPKVKQAVLVTHVEDPSGVSLHFVQPLGVNHEQHSQ